MLRLKDIYTHAETKDVLIGKKKVRLRELSVARSEQIDRAYPEPIPPMGTDLKKGSLAEPQPNRNDPKYLADRSEWSSKVAVIELAVAMELVTEAGIALPPEEAEADGFREWADIACRELKRMGSRTLLAAIRQF